MPAFPRSRRLRLSIWIAAVLVLFFGQLFWIGAFRKASIAQRNDLLTAGEIIFNAILFLIVLLLWTTPADAIQLKRLHSEWIILIGVVILQAIAGGAGRTSMAISAAAIIATAVLLFALRRKKTSTWWAVLLAWNPLMVVLQLTYGTS